MKKIRSLLVSVAALLMLLALVATEAKAQSLFSTQFAGSFSLPFMVQWGTVILPPGEYSLYYGMPGNAGPNVVEIRGEVKGSPHGFILGNGHDQISEKKSVLVCVLEGKRAYVRELRMGAIGESAEFALPHGVKVRAWVVAGKRNNKGDTQLTEERIPIERVPVK